jgi:hypothetical protein
MKAVAPMIVHAEPRVESAEPRQRKRSMLVSENDTKHKRKSRAVPKAASPELPSFDLAPLEAEPLICVQADRVGVDAPTPAPLPPPPPEPEPIDEYEYVPGRPITCSLCGHNGVPLNEGHVPYCAECGLLFSSGGDDAEVEVELGEYTCTADEKYAELFKREDKAFFDLKDAYVTRYGYVDGLVDSLGNFATNLPEDLAAMLAKLRKLQDQKLQQRKILDSLPVRRVV